MKVLVACEYSGIVRDAFIRAGHDALSCDIIDTESPGPHYLGDVRDVLYDDWDLMIGHPPCTYLTNAANRWLYEDCATGTAADRWDKLREGAAFFNTLWNAPIDKICLENPLPGPEAAKLIPRLTDKVEPGDFGHEESKGICLWLKNLPPLMSTMICDYREHKVHWCQPGKDRAKIRSRFFEGIAEAMAHQWG